MRHICFLALPSLCGAGPLPSSVGWGTCSLQASSGSRRPVIQPVDSAWQGEGTGSVHCREAFPAGTLAPLPPVIPLGWKAWPMGAAESSATQSPALIFPFPPLPWAHSFSLPPAQTTHHHLDPAPYLLTCTFTPSSVLLPSTLSLTPECLIFVPLQSIGRPHKVS